MGNPFKAKTSKAAAPAAPREEEIPVGPISKLIEWVGDDKEKAFRVLEQELAQDKPRKTLTDQLEEIIDD